MAVVQGLPKKEDLAHVIPRFYEDMIQTGNVDDNGLPVFKTVEYVEILIAGDRGNAPVKRVNDAIKAKFPDQYARWKATKVNADMIGDGIPLTLWPLIPKEMAKALEYMNVFTVQQLAGLNDHAISKPGAIGLRDMREKAKAFIESSKSAAPIAKLEIENKELKDKLHLMQGQIEQLIGELRSQKAQPALSDDASDVVFADEPVVQTRRKK